jgi:hypothetical protein
MTKYFIKAYISATYEVMIEADSEEHAEELFDELDFGAIDTYELSMSVDRLDVVEASEVSEKHKRGVKTIKVGEL